MGFLSGVLSAGANLLSGGSGWGSAFSSALGFLGSERTNDANAGMSERQMEFQKYMSDTAHRREVKDLKAAGLNPMLSSKYGGASTPAGSTAVMQNSAEAASRSANDYMSRALVQSQIRAQEAQAALSSAQAVKAAAETRNISSQADLSEFEFGLKDRFRDQESNARFSRLLKEEFGNKLESYESATMHDALVNINRDLIAGGGRSLYEVLMKLDVDERREALSHLRELVTSQRYGHSQERAMSEFYNTAFGREIAPYLNSASSLVQSASGITGLLRGKRGAGGITINNLLRQKPTGK